MNTILTRAKSLAALVGGIATALLGIYADGDLGKTLTVIAAACTAIGVYAVPNADPAGAHQDESVQPPTRRRGQRGATTAETVLIVLGILALIVLVSWYFHPHR